MSGAYRFCLLSSVFCLLSSVFCLLSSVFCLLALCWLSRKFFALNLFNFCCLNQYRQARRVSIEVCRR
ncbi:hypothetical protein C7R88_14795 [Plesiomonas shigelloides]|nr:hypothetical protein C7R88_14795 [Plesiomonas shigelloides]